jgi:hypothetical protein
MWLKLDGPPVAILRSVELSDSVIGLTQVGVKDCHLRPQRGGSFEQLDAAHGLPLVNEYDPQPMQRIYTSGITPEDGLVDSGRRFERTAPLVNQGLLQFFLDGRHDK